MLHAENVVAQDHEPSRFCWSFDGRSLKDGIHERQDLLTIALLCGIKLHELKAPRQFFALIFHSSLRFLDGVADSHGTGKRACLATFCMR